MAILDALRRLFVPNASEDPRAPYLAHYSIVDRAGATHQEGGVPVIFFEDAPAIAKLSLLQRGEPAREWTLRRA